MELRLAQPSDAADLFWLNRKFNGEDSTTRELIENSLSNNAQEVVCVAVEDGTVVGFVCGQLFKSMCYRSHYAEITELYVRDEYRRRGIGSRLLAFIEQHFIEMGIRDFQLFTGQSNTGAQALYEASGYARSDELMYRKRLRP